MKKTSLKKIAALLLAMVMLLGIAACGSTPENKTPSTPSKAENKPTSQGGTESSDVTPEPELIRLKGVISEGTPTTADINTLAIWDFAEEATGVRVDWEVLPWVSAAEQLSIKFATNDMPDLFFKCVVDSGDITKYANDGMLVPIDEYISDPAVAPNFSRWMQENEAIGKVIRAADGHYYGFPNLVIAGASNVSPKVYFNQKWLDAQGLSAPTTTDELYEVLTAMKDFDYNENGEADEIPLSGGSWSNIMAALKGSFGLGTRGGYQTYWDIDPDTNELRFMPTTDRYKELLQYLNKLYTEKLLDQEIFTIDATQLMAKAAQNVIGIVFTHNDVYMAPYDGDFVAPAGAFVGPHGDNLYAGINNAVNAPNTWITSRNEHVAETVHFIDYFYSEEGILHYYMGVEGETFEFGDDGLPYFTEFVTNNPDGLTKEEALARFTIWGNGANPSVADDIHFGNHLVDADTVESATNLRKTGPEEIWGGFPYSAEDAEMISVYETDIITYVDDMTPKFVTGEVSFDEWDNFVATIERMDLAGYYELVQRAVDNYNK